MSEHERPKTLSAEEARQGEIILRKPWQRVVFVSGLIGCAFVPLVLYAFAA